MANRNTKKKVKMSFWKPNLKNNKVKVGISKQFKLKIPTYLTSHSKPQKLRRYIANKKRLVKMDKSSVIPFIMIGKPKHISKENLTWPQAKRRFPLLNPYKDTDRDGVKNMFDCRPFNRKKQGFEHYYSFSDTSSKRIKTVKMPPRRFLEETYKEVKARERKGQKIPTPYHSQEEYEKRVLSPESVAYQKKKIQSQEENVPIGFLTYEEGQPISHEGRHAAKAAEELEMETIPVTIERYKEEEAPEVEEYEEYEEQYGDKENYDIDDSDDKTLDYEEEQEEEDD